MYTSIKSQQSSGFFGKNVANYTSYSRDEICCIPRKPQPQTFLISFLNEILWLIWHAFRWWSLCSVFTLDLSLKIKFAFHTQISM